MTDPLETVRQLIAMAESTPYPAEAEAFMAKATALMVRHHLDRAMLDGRDDARQPTMLELRITRPYPGLKALLIDGVAGCFGCRSVRVRTTAAAGTDVVCVVGFPEDLELVETLVTSLLVQMAAAMLAAQPPARSPAGSQAWRRSFITGFVLRVTERLDADRRAAVAERSESGASVALVLADRCRRVDDETRARFPRVRVSRISAGSSAQGHAAGAEAGDRADLGRRRLDS